MRRTGPGRNSARWTCSGRSEEPLTANQKHMNEELTTTDEDEAIDDRAANNKQGINVAGDTMTRSTADYPEAQRNLVRWLFGYTKDQEWTWKQVQEASKISQTVLYRIWTGKYTNPESGELIGLEKVCVKIERFRKLAEKRDLIKRLPFIETSVWTRVSKICDEALVGQTIAFIYGESQIGKTAALREYARRNNHGQTAYVLTPASAGVQSVAKSIATACHIGDRTCFEKLRDRICGYLDETKLLIMDEVHEAFVSYQKHSTVKVFSMLRQIQELTGCGMVLCGTNVFRSQLERGEFAQSLKQLRKRGIWELQLEKSPAAEDLTTIRKYYRLPKPEAEAAQYVKFIASEFGLGKFTKYLARGAQLASDLDERFDWEHFNRVVESADTMRREAA